MPQGAYLPEGMLYDTEKNRQKIQSLSAIMRAADEGSIMEAPAILCDAAHNLIIDLGCMSGIIPRGEAAIGIENGTTREIAVISRVGRPVCFKVIGFTEDEAVPKAILSRRAAQEEALTYFMNDLHPGEIVQAKTTHLEPFGAFVDIGAGIISLIGIENISVSRISHPSDRFSIGQKIYAVVSGIDRNLRRITLTHKELLGTWEENAARFSAGETVRGIVRDTPDYGVFVELAPNLSGLAEKRSDLSPGQHVSVYIKSIIPERMKVKLIVIDRLEKTETPAPFQYFLPDGCLLKWTYTPKSCKSKLIQTNFLSPGNIII